MSTARCSSSATPAARPAWPSTRPTPLDVLEWVIDKVDLVLIMSVNPGFGGPELHRERAAQDRQGAQADRRQRPRHPAEVDGGIKVDNIRRVADAGADTFVAGSAIFGQRDYQAVIDAMRAELALRDELAAA
jgi:ribulose-phosphate 3-epimerase